MANVINKFKYTYNCLFIIKLENNITAYKIKIRVILKKHKNYIQHSKREVDGSFYNSDAFYISGTTSCISMKNECIAYNKYDHKQWLLFLL